MLNIKSYVEMQSCTTKLLYYQTCDVSATGALIAPSDNLMMRIDRCVGGV